MELKYIVPNVAQTFGNLEFAGENKVEQQRINGRYTPVSEATTCIRIFKEPTILSLCFLQRLARKTLNQNSVSNLSIQRLPQRATTSRDVDLQTTF